MTVTLCASASVNLSAKRTLALSHQANVIVFAQIGREVERVQSVPLSEIFAVDEQSSISTQLARSSKHSVVSSYILSIRKIRLDGFDGVLLLTVRIHGISLSPKCSKLNGFRARSQLNALVFIILITKRAGSWPENNLS